MTDFRSQLPIDHLRALARDPATEPPRGDNGPDLIAHEFAPDTMTESVRDLFVRRPSTWIDGRAFQAIGGFAGWSARIRDCRKRPYRMVIINRTTRHHGITGTAYVWLPLAVPEDITPAVRAKVRAYEFTGRPLADWEAVKHG
jgi:hypothetical protein